MIRPLFALFLRSMREDTRSKLPPIFRAALVLIILLIIWSNQRSFSFRTSPGREFFLMVMMLNTGFIALMALSIFPSAIAEEKEDGTLTLLRMTNLSGLSILLGKGASRLLAALLLIIVQIPFTLLGITLGGVSMDQILFSYAILGSTTIFLCSVALAASVYCRTAMRAGFLTGTIGGILFFLLPMLSVFAFFSRMGPGTMTAGNPFEQIAKWTIEANPAYALFMLFENVGRTMYVTNQIWIMLGGSVVFFLTAWLLFPRFCADSEETAARPSKRKNGKTKARRFSIGRPGLRPVTWKDWNFLAGGKSGFLLRLGLATAILGGSWLFTEYVEGANFRRWANWTAEEIKRRIWQQTAVMSVTFGCMCGALEILLITGRIFGIEYRTLTLSGLIGLPWKAGRIIRQKILGCLPVIFPWLLLILAGFLMHPDNPFRELAYEIRTMGDDDIAAAWYVTAQALILLSVIAWFSLKIRRGALPASIAIVGGANIVWGIILDDTGGGTQEFFLFASAILSSLVFLFMCYLVRERMQAAASEDS